MRWFPACIFALALSSMAAGATEDARLDYRIKVRLKGQPDVLESGFRVLATAPLVTRNQMQRRAHGQLARSCRWPARARPPPRPSWCGP